MSEEKKYGSAYEKAVLTSDHPEKTVFKPLEPPPYIESASAGVWLATRWEELVVVAFLFAAFCYVAGFYAFVYTCILKPLCYAWDAAALTIATLKMAPRGVSKRARTPLYALTVATVAARFYQPSLYPSFYPWQP